MTESAEVVADAYVLRIQSNSFEVYAGKPAPIAVKNGVKAVGIAYNLVRMLNPLKAMRLHCPKSQ